MSLQIIINSLSLFSFHENCIVTNNTLVVGNLQLNVYVIAWLSQVTKRFQQGVALGREFTRLSEILQFVIPTSKVSFVIF